MVEEKVEHEVYTLTEVCKMLLVTRQTLLRWQKEGRFPMRVAKGLFSKAQVDDWLQGTFGNTGEHLGTSQSSDSRL